MERLRRTMMFVPGNNPGLLRDAGIYGADSLILDLEDSVALTEKDAARFLVYNALKSMDYGEAELLVRINPVSTPYGAKDIDAAVRAGVHVIRAPKVESAEEVAELEAEIEKAERKAGVPAGRTLIMAALESAKGVLSARAIACASKRMTGIALSAEDYCADLRVSRSGGGAELAYARQVIVVAARAAGISAIDTVFTRFSDTEAFLNEVRLIKELGFDGKSVIHPSQITVVHSVFKPSEKEVENARRIAAADRESRKRGLGVISLDGRMIDRPVVLRALRVLELAGIETGDRGGRL